MSTPKFKVGDFVTYRCGMYCHPAWNCCTGCVGIIVSVVNTKRIKNFVVSSIECSYRIKWIRYTPEMDENKINAFDNGKMDDIFMEGTLLPYKDN